MNYIALRAVDDVVLAVLASRRADLCKCVATGAFGKGQAAALQVSRAPVAEGGNIVFLLALIARQHDGERSHQRANNVHCQPTIAKAQFLSDQRVGRCLDCPRSAIFFRKGSSEAGLRKRLHQSWRNITLSLGATSLRPQLFDSHAMCQVTYLFLLLCWGKVEHKVCPFGIRLSA